MGGEKRKHARENTAPPEYVRMQGARTVSPHIILSKKTDFATMTVFSARSTKKGSLTWQR